MRRRKERGLGPGCEGSDAFKALLERRENERLERSSYERWELGDRTVEVVVVIKMLAWLKLVKQPFPTCPCITRIRVSCFAPSNVDMIAT